MALLPGGAASEAPRTKATSATTLRGGPRGVVLLVDDSQLVRDIIGTTLRTAGYTVQEAEDGSVALSLLGRCRYDVVMTDLKMPGMDGFDVLEAVRRQQPDAELIVLTGSHSKDINAAVRALRLGAHDFLMKPLSGADQAVLSVDRAVEKKRQREALREAEDRYRQLFDRVPIALYRTTRQGRFLEANPALVQMLGCPDRETLLATNAAVFYVDPEDRQHRCEAVEREGILQGFEVSLRRLDGSQVWVEENVRAVRNSEGSLVYYEGSLQDVTERRRAEEALRLQTDQLEGVAEAMTAFLTSDDLEAACSRLLATALAQTDSGYGFIGVVDGPLLGIAAEESVPWSELVGSEAVERAEQGREDTGRLTFARGVLERILDSEAAPRAVLDPSLLAVPILRGQEVVGVIAVGGRSTAQGTTGRARLELLIHATGVIFGSYRQAQTQTLLEAQLRQAQKMEAVGRLAGGVAHDFNNLLTVITGYGEMLQKDLSPGQPRRRVDEILKAGERAAGLVRQLLAFSRRQMVHPRVLDLNAVVSDLDSLVRRLIGEDVELFTELTPDLGRVTADRGQIEQVIMNLVVNSRDAMPSGGRLAIETGDVDLDDEFVRGHVGARTGPHVLLAVTDTGQGMDPETQSHIFEPFFTTKEQGKGTGLGLATVYGIVKQAGGDIWVESEPGHGTTFQIYLPRTVAPAEALSPAEPSEQPLRGSETILLVEDEDMVRDLVSEALREYGYDVRPASSGLEALRLVGEHRGAIPLLVTDVVMPGMSGPQLAEQLKVLRPEMRVLFMSGYNEREAFRSAVAAGAFLQKPFKVEELAARVHELLAVGDTPGPPASAAVPTEPATGSKKPSSEP